MRKISNYTVHTKIHAVNIICTEEKLHACSICEKTFPNAYRLKSHMYCHTGERMFVHRRERTEVSHECKICFKVLKNSKCFQAYMKIHAGKIGRRHACNICQKKFQYASSVEKHMTYHTGEKKYNCYLCHSQFTQPCHLKTHMLRRHSDTTKEQNDPYAFTCDLCNKTFTRFNSLNEYMTVHFSEARHKCDTCGKRFSRKKNLHRHVQLHFEVTRFSCGICNKNFTRRYLLLSHMFSHAGYQQDQKPHVCGICKLGFTESCNFRAHMKSSHTYRR